MTGFESITIRRASGADADALDRLAGLDSTRLPSDDFLIAEVAGEPWAAVGIRTGAVVANPFRPTADLTDLLRLRAERVRGAGATPRRASRFRRLVRATRLWTSSPRSERGGRRAAAPVGLAEECESCPSVPA